MPEHSFMARWLKSLRASSKKPNASRAQNQARLVVRRLEDRIVLDAATAAAGAASVTAWDPSATEPIMQDAWAAEEQPANRLDMGAGFTSTIADSTSLFASHDVVEVDPTRLPDQATTVVDRSVGDRDMLLLQSEQVWDEVLYQHSDSSLTITFNDDDFSTSIQLTGVEFIDDQLHSETRTFELGETTLELRDDFDVANGVNIAHLGAHEIRFASATSQLDIVGGEVVSLVSWDTHYDTNLSVTEAEHVDVSGSLQMGAADLSIVGEQIVVSGELGGVDAEFSLQANAIVVQESGLLANHNGMVELDAADLQVLGRVEAGAGQIHLDAGGDGLLQIDGRVDASSAEGSGGQIVLAGERIMLAESATLNASGKMNGGEILVGGAIRGQSIGNNARAVWVSENATLRADSHELGDGGTVVVWAGDLTVFKGSISAVGGRLGGDGGFVEVSADRLHLTGEVNVDASRGRAGTFLIDPNTVTIRAGTMDGDDDNANDNLFEGVANGNLNFDDMPNNFDIYESELEGMNGNILIEAKNSITVDAGFTSELLLDTNASLTLRTRNAMGDGATGINLTGGAGFSIRAQGSGDITIETGSDGMGGGGGHPAGPAPVVVSNITLDTGVLSIDSEGSVTASGVISTNSLEIAAGGNIDVSNAGNLIGDVAVNTTGSVNVRSSIAMDVTTVGATTGVTGATGVTLQSGGLLTIADPVSTTNAAIMLSGSSVDLTMSDSDVNAGTAAVTIDAGTGSFSSVAGANVSGSDVALTANAASLGGGLIGSATVSVAPGSSTAISLGAGAATGLALTDTELNNIQAPVVRIGDNTNTSSITFAGNFTAAATFAPTALRLSSAGNISGAAATVDLSTSGTDLALEAGGNVDLSNAANQIDILAADVTGTVNVAAAALTVGTADAIVGVTGAAGVTLQSAAALTVTQVVASTNNAIMLSGAGVALTTTDGDVAAGTGAVNINAGTGTFSSIANANVGGGDISVLADAVTLGGQLNGTLVAITSNSALAISLGAGAAAGLALTDTELNNIQAANVRIGDTTNTTGVTFAGAFTADANFATTALRLDSAAAIDASGFAVDLTGGLAAQATGNVDFSNAANQLNTVAANTSGTVNFRSTTALTVGLLDSVDGVTGTAGVTLQSDAAVTVSRQVSTTNNTIDIIGLGINLNDANADISAGTSILSLNAGAGVLSSVANADIAADTICITAASIALSGGVSAQNLAINIGGDVTLTSATNNLTNIAINTTGSVNVQSTDPLTVTTIKGVVGVTGATGVTLQSGGLLTIADPVSTTNAAIMLSGSSVDLTMSDSDVNAGTAAVTIDAGTGSFSSVAGANVSGSDVALTANAASLGGALIGSATVSVAPGSSTAISLGAGAATGLALTDTELNNIQAPVVRIGDNTNTSSITFAGSFTAAATFAPTALRLSSAGNISGAAATVDLSTSGTDLALEAGGNVDLSNAANQIDILAADVTGAVNVAAAALTVGTADAIVGVTGAAGVTLQSAAALTVTQVVASTNNTIMLSGAGVALTTTDGDVTAGTGAVNINAGTGTFSSIANANVGGGDISVLADAVTLGGQLNGTLVAITSNSALAISLGAGAAAGLALTDTELNNIQAANVRIGDTTNTTGVTFAGAFTADANFATTALRLDSAAAIDASGFAVDLTGGLAAQATGNVDFSNAANQLNTVAANTSGTVNFRSTTALTVGLLDSVDGVTGTAGVTLQSDAAVTVSRQVSTTNNTIDIIGLSINLNDANADISAGTSILSLNAGAGVLSSVADADIAADTICITAASIALSGGVSAQNLAINIGGDVTLTSATNNLTNIAINTTGSVNVQSTDPLTVTTIKGVVGVTGATGVTLQSDGLLTIADPVSTTNAAIMLTGLGVTLTMADSDVSAGTAAVTIDAGAGSFSSVAGANVSGSDVALTANAASLGGGLIGSATVSVAPGSSTAISLGAGAATGLALTDTELNNIQAPVVRIGDNTNTSSITFAGSFTAAATFAPTALRLSSAGNISGAAATVDLSTSGTDLALEAGGNVDLSNAANQIDILAADVTGTVNVAAAALTVGTADAIVGVTGAAGVTLQSAAALTVTQVVASTNNAIMLSGAGVALTTTDGDVTAGTGAVNINAGTGTFSSIANANVGGGDISVLADAVTLGGQLNGTLVAITSNSALAISLGAGAAAGLALTDTELNNIQAANVRIGDTTNTTGVTFAGAFTADANFATTALRLDSAAAIDASGFAVDLTGGLAAQATGNVDFSNAANQLNTVAANTSGTVNFRSTTALTVGLLDSVDGVTGTAGVTLQSDAAVTVSRQVSTTNNTIDIIGLGINLNDANADISAGTSILSLNAGAGVLSSVANADIAADTICITAASIALSGGVSAQNLAINIGGDVTLTSATNNLTNIAINTTGSVNVQSTDPLTVTTIKGVVGVTGATGVTLQSGGLLTIADPVSTTNAAIMLSGSSVDLTMSDSDVNAGTAAVTIDAGTGSFSSVAGANVSGSDVALTANAASLGGALIGSATVSVAPGSSTAISLGAGAATGLALTDTELNNIQAPVVRIGDNTNTSSITFAGSFTAAATFAPTALRLSSAGNISGAAATVDLSTSGTDLALEAGGNVELSNAANQIDILAANVTGSASVASGSALTVGTVDGVLGVTGPNGVTIQSSNLVTVERAITSTDTDIIVRGLGISLATVNADIAAGTATLTLDAMTGALNSVLDADISADTICLIAGSLNLLGQINATNLAVQTTGNVTLTNAVNGLVNIAISSTGTVDVQSTNPIFVTTVKGVVGVSGATGVALTTTGLLTVEQAIASTGGPVSLTGDGITLSTASATVTTSTGDISLGSSGGLELSAGTIQSTSGQIALEGTNDVNLGIVSTSSKVDIQSLSGAIMDPVDQAAHVTGGEILFRADTGIGQTITAAEGPLRNTGNPIDISTTGTIAAETNSGSIDLFNYAAGGVTVGSVQAINTSETVDGLINSSGIVRVGMLQSPTTNFDVADTASIDTSGGLAVQNAANQFGVIPNPADVSVIEGNVTVMGRAQGDGVNLFVETDFCATSGLNCSNPTETDFFVTDIDPFTHMTVYAEVPNSSLTSFDIELKVSIPDLFVLGPDSAAPQGFRDFGLASNIVEAKVISLAFFGPAIESTVDVQVTATPPLSTGDLAPPSNTTVREIAADLDTNSAANQSVQTVANRFKLWIVDPAADDESPANEDLIDLPDDVLSNLSELFERLPDDHYRIYLERDDGSYELQKDFVVQNGRELEFDEEDEEEVRRAGRQNAPRDQAERVMLREHPAHPSGSATLEANWFDRVQKAMVDGDARIFSRAARYARSQQD